MPSALASKQVVLSLYNIAGDRVIRREFSKAGPVINLDVQHLIQGSYYLYMEAEGHRSAEKIIINR
jgi:hypothetical protein